MHNFVPTPQFSSEEWRAFGERQKEANMLDVPQPKLGPDSWVVGVDYLFDLDGPFDGDPVYFSTATDMLLWWRWLVLLRTVFTGSVDPPPIMGTFGLVEHPDEARAFIDSQPDGASALEVFKACYNQFGLHCHDEMYLLVNFVSIHEFLSMHAQLPVIRKFLECDEVECVDDVWAMPPEAWEHLSERLPNLSLGFYPWWSWTTIAMEMDMEEFETDRR